MDDFCHVAYADDHLTVIVLRFQIHERKGVVEKVTEVVICKCRQLLDLATRIVGCGINPAKSEVLMAPKRLVTGIDARSLSGSDI